jgi:hypothetical protein
MPIACPSLIGGSYPELCAAVDHYCERTSSALDSEPVNALTNAAFLIGACVAWCIRSSHPRGDQGKLVVALILTMALVGLGSFLFHTVATRWTEWADVLPIMLFMLLYLWIVLTRFFGWPTWLKSIALLAYFAMTFYAEASVPAGVLWGGALYVPTVLLILVIATSLYLRQTPGAGVFLIATAVFLVSFAARTLDASVCAAFPLGTHFVWHLLNATLLFILVRAAILYSAPAHAARRSSSPLRRSRLRPQSKTANQPQDLSRATSRPGNCGSAKRKIAPPPGLSSARSRPPCASTITRQIERPMPRPRAFVVTNGSNSCVRIVGDTPVPVSATLTSTMLSAVSLVAIVSTRRLPSPRSHCAPG